MTFRETIQILTKIFGEPSSLFNTRWKYLNFTKNDCEDYATYTSTVNRWNCERFQLNEITPDKFKCLIFIQGLTSPSEKEVRKSLLTKLEQDQKITLQSLAEENQHILNLWADTAKIEERGISNIHTIKNKPQGQKIKPFFKIIQCYGCGELYLFKDCPFKHKKMPYLRAQRTQILTLQTWKGKLFKK